LKLFPSAHLVTDRSAGAQDGERNQILGDNFLLAAEPAADSTGQHPHAVLRQSQEGAQFVTNQERHLRTGAQDQTTIVDQSAQGAVGFQLGMRNPLRTPGSGDRDG